MTQTLDSLLSLKKQQQRPTIVCLCGSTRFSEAFQQATLHETIAGKIVQSIGCNTKSDTDLLALGQLTPEAKDRLDVLHFWKIDLADEVLVLNVGGYVGESTRREVEYARRKGKVIRWLEPDKALPQPCGYAVVGVMVWHRDKLLMFERNTPPAGIACVAGHIDDGDTPRQAAVKEVSEEVGISICERELSHIGTKYLSYKCRRQPERGEGGHAWFVYEVQVHRDQIQASERETKNAQWYTTDEVRSLYDEGKLEPAWEWWLHEYGVLFS